MNPKNNDLYADILASSPPRGLLVLLDDDDDDDIKCNAQRVSAASAIPSDIHFIVEKICPNIPHVTISAVPNTLLQY